MALLYGSLPSRPKTLVRSGVRSGVRSSARSMFWSLVRSRVPTRSHRVPSSPSLWVFLLVAATCALPVVAFAQADVNDVHIQSRDVEKAPEKANTDELATQT